MRVGTAFAVTGDARTLVDRSPRENAFGRVPEPAPQTDPVLEQLDGLLGDDEVYARVRVDPGRRHPKTPCHGRHSPPGEAVQLLRRLGLVAAGFPVALGGDAGMGEVQLLDDRVAFGEDRRPVATRGGLVERHPRPVRWLPRGVPPIEAVR